MSQENLEWMRQVADVWGGRYTDAVEELLRPRLAPDFELHPLYLGQRLQGGREAPADVGGPRGHVAGLSLGYQGDRGPGRARARAGTRHGARPREWDPDRPRPRHALGLPGRYPGLDEELHHQRRRSRSRGAAGVGRPSKRGDILPLP